MNSFGGSDSSSVKITEAGGAASENYSADTRHEDATMSNTLDDDFDNIDGPPTDDDSRDMVASNYVPIIETDSSKILVESACSSTFPAPLSLCQLTAL